MSWTNCGSFDAPSDAIRQELIADGWVSVTAQQKFRIFLDRHAGRRIEQRPSIPRQELLQQRIDARVLHGQMNDAVAEQDAGKVIMLCEAFSILSLTCS